MSIYSHANSKNFNSAFLTVSLEESIKLGEQFYRFSALFFYDQPFIWPLEGKLIPIEVKIRDRGKLKSIHLYMDLVSHQMAIRFYAGEILITESVTPEGKISLA